MLTWITVISLVLTLAVGVLSALFKTVRKHEVGKLPRLTEWGWVLLTTLLMLCITSVVLVFVTSGQADAAQEELNKRLSQLSSANEELKKGNAELRKGNSDLQAGNTQLIKLAGTNLDTLVKNQREATDRHIQSLDRFSSLIGREENIGRNTAPKVDRISLVLTLRADQKVASPFIARIKNQVRPSEHLEIRPSGELIDSGTEPLRLDPQSTVFPNPDDAGEADLYKFLTFVRVNVEIFNAPVEIQYPKPRVGGFFRLRPSPVFSAVVDAPIITGNIGGFGTSYAEEPPVTVSYDADRNLIVFEANELKNVIDKGFSTWEDLANFFVVVKLEGQTIKPQVTVLSLTLLSSSRNYLTVRDFKPFHELTYFFIARIPADAKWK